MKIIRLLATSLLVTLSVGISSCSKETIDDGIEWKSSMVLNVSQPGTLNRLIPQEKRTLIEELILTGNINSDDFLVLNELGINGNLTSLDLSSAYIDELSIPNAAFRGCSKIEKISLPTNITNIGDCAFEGCYSLSSIDLPSNLSFMGNAVFSGCKGLSSIIIPEKIETINTSTFSGCENLTSINIPQSVQHIKYQAFTGCKKITSLNIPGNVTILEEGAFYNCTSLTRLIFEDGITELKIGEDYTYNTVFSGCPLEEVYLGRNLKRTNQLEFLTSALFMDIKTLKKITISGTGIKVEPLAFSYCENLNTVVIGNGVKTIGNGAFSQFTITSITLGNSVENIDNSAFYRCNITSIHIPSSVKRIGNAAFYECYNLADIYMQSETPPTIMEDAFGWALTECTLHVPYGSRNKYATTQYWSRFSNIVEY